MVAGETSWDTASDLAKMQPTPWLTADQQYWQRLVEWRRPPQTGIKILAHELPLEQTSATEFASRKPHSPGLNLRVGLIGTNFKCAPISVREELARKITIDKLAKLTGSDARGSVAEAVLLSTCNRVEVYFASEDFEDASKLIGELFLLDQNSAEELRIYKFAEEKAVEHIFEVSCGLDSLVIGEAQILAQVRHAANLAKERGLCGVSLSKLFGKAHTTGVEIREAYPKFTNGFKKSVSRSVSEIITAHFQSRNLRPNVLLVGSGKMIKLAVLSFDREQFGKLVVAARKQSLGDFRADQVVSVSEISRTIIEQEIDVVITATSSDEYVIKLEDIESISKAESSRELLIVDISVPRNVDPRISSRFPNVTLLNLDDLKDRVPTVEREAASQTGSGELEEIRETISVRAEEYKVWSNEINKIGPLLAQVRVKAERIRAEELENALSRLGKIDPEQRDVIVKMSERIIRRFLHEPSANLRSFVRKGGAKSEEYANLLRELFSIDSPDSQVEKSNTEGSIL